MHTAIEGNNSLKTQEAGERHTTDSFLRPNAVSFMRKTACYCVTKTIFGYGTFAYLCRIREAFKPGHLHTFLPEYGVGDNSCLT